MRKKENLSSVEGFEEQKDTSLPPEKPSDPEPAPNPPTLITHIPADVHRPAVPIYQPPGE